MIIFSDHFFLYKIVKKYHPYGSVDFVKLVKHISKHKGGFGALVELDGIGGVRKHYFLYKHKLD